MNKKLTHIAGNFLIPATGSFLNGAGLSKGEDRNVVIPKTFSDGENRVPYVSAQAWKRWLRNTVVEEQKWPPSEIRAIGQSTKGTTNKISGELDPVTFPEDDIFGYMMAKAGQGKTEKAPTDQEENEEDDDSENVEMSANKNSKPREKVKAIMRASPFMASLLVSLRGTGWKGKDEGFVHLKDGTPQPYTTEFYNTHLQGVFCLNLSRLCIFSNVGDRIELDEDKAKKYLREGKLKEVEEIFRNDGGNKKSIGKVYSLTNADAERKERAAAIIRSLAVLRGGAKQAAFGTSVEPQAMVLAGLSCGNPIFHHLFNDEGDGPQLKLKTLTEVLSDYKDRICTPVYIGIRTGYLKNESDVRSSKGMVDGVNVEVMSPLQAADAMSSSILSS